MKILLAILVALAIAAGGAYGGYYLSQQSTPVQVEEKNLTHFQPMERFIVSVGSEGYSRYLVLELSLATHDNSLFSNLGNWMPLLRNVLVTHFAKIQREEAKSMFEDVPEVQKVLLEKFNRTLFDNGVRGQLDQVLVTNVFIQ